ncbi:UNVERIFIED_CONTAM: hypothetical protein Slati_3499600 [Sesamum latifolium]|uniref:Uncharacterized protein n=1 Tax=Sesamum latifolium TaxID=2727402 RepID=A0AAW2UJ32_9LAMI
MLEWFCKKSETGMRKEEKMERALEMGSYQKTVSTRSTSGATKARGRQDGYCSRLTIAAFAIITATP